MATTKVCAFIIQLSTQGKLHPLYIECLAAYSSSVFPSIAVKNKKSKKIEKEFFASYNNLLGHLKKEIKLSDNAFLSEELGNVLAALKPEVLSKQAQLIILQSILNYAKKFLDIDSPNIPSIITLKRDKPMLTPVDLTKLPIVELINTQLSRELIAPHRDLDQKAKLGRLLLILYYTVNIEKTEHLQLMVKYPQDIFYVGGICYWQCRNIRINSPRYVLSDMAVMALQQWHNVHHGASFAIKPSQFKAALVYYLNYGSCFDWSDISLLKLRVLRRIENVLRYGAVQYRMYMLPGVCQPLPTNAFVRILTGKVSANAEPYLSEAISDKTKAFRDWSTVANENTSFVSMEKTLEQLDKVYTELCKLLERNKPRSDSLMAIAIILDQPSSKSNPYFWILCAWLYSLLKTGGTHKRRLKVLTTIDYVKSLSRPFLIIFCTSDIYLLSGEDWAEKLNDAADHFSSAQRKKYIYYFAQFLIDSGFVRDLCLSDIEVLGSSSKVDSNLISHEHVQAILSYLDTQSAYCPVHRDAYFLLCFCFFTGLRRNEAAKLTWGDFSFSLIEPNQYDFDYVQLSVRPNKHRTLKTTSARRELPLDALWPKTVLSKLRYTYRIVNGAGAKNSTLLFDNQRRVNQAYDLITDLMRYYTQDQSLRVHHLRHSFANWTWCRLNANLITVGRRHLTLFNDEIFDEKYLKRLQTRLRYNDNTRKKMFILSHMMGHKDVQSTLNSYLHLTDLLYYLQHNSCFELTKYFTSECVGRVILQPLEPGLSLAERIKYYTQEVMHKLDIKPAPETVNLVMPSLANFSANIKTDLTISSLTWANALNALNTSSIIEVAAHYAVPLEQLQKLLSNAEAIHMKYPRRGKRLPLIPKFPRIDISVANIQQNKNLANSTRVFTFLCNKLDNIITEGGVTLENIRLGVEILNYAVPGKSNALRCPDSKVSRMFIRFCQLLGLKDRHLRFKYHRAGLPLDTANRIEERWIKTIIYYGFSEKNFIIGSEGEGRFLGKHDGNGFLEISIVNNTYKRVQRHRSLFSFLHFILILSYSEKK
ncbi:tyrosine-type recombinase/integrase [Shewanella mangrovisoli]|uniref:tyrosine-type recombinase/integrase n=1 Tax=Shewanella mangrovisoli TaxID=2864211 RepID=UPI0035B92DEB